ncbi:MAG: hypothetical protein MRJ65_10625 [Candidatus Brocadiaceae bacterium]|nr:hypothetical protein [Candidatus Brocadiaceae bacterium]
MQAPISAVFFQKLLDQSKDDLFYELGLLLPKVKIGCDDRLEGNTFRIQLNDVRLPPVFGLSPEQLFINAPPESLSFLKKALYPVMYALLHNGRVWKNWMPSIIPTFSAYIFNNPLRGKVRGAIILSPIIQPLLYEI